MAKRRKPEISVTTRAKPNIEALGSTARSRTITPSGGSSLIEKNNNRSNRDRIQGVSASTRQSRPQVEAPTTQKATRFFSIKDSGDANASVRPSVEPINNDISRSKPITRKVSEVINRKKHSVEPISGSVVRSKLVRSSIEGGQGRSNITTNPIDSIRPLSNIGGGSIPRYKQQPGPLRVSDL